MRSASIRHPAQLNAGDPSRDVQSGLLLNRNWLQLDVVIGAADQYIRPDTRHNGGLRGGSNVAAG